MIGISVILMIKEYIEIVVRPACVVCVHDIIVACL